MPIGFNVETGSSLSNRLLRIVPVVLTKLKNGREAKTITPERPISAQALCAWINDIRGEKIESSHIRAIINYLRRNKESIASEAEGYFYAVEHSELNLTLQHLKQRAAAINSAINGLEHSFDNEDGQQVLL